MEKRAKTFTEKKMIVLRLLTAWADIPEQRLGQLLVNSLSPKDLFYLEDADLVDTVEKYVAAANKEPTKTKK